MSVADIEVSVSGILKKPLLFLTSNKILDDGTGIVVKTPVEVIKRFTCTHICDCEITEISTDSCAHRGYLPLLTHLARAAVLV